MFKGYLQFHSLSKEGSAHREATLTPVVTRHSSWVFHTGAHLQVPRGCRWEWQSKSCLMFTFSLNVPTEGKKEPFPL